MIIIEVFKHIWQNKLSRIILISAIFLIVGASIIRINIGIYNFFYKISKGQVFFDPNSFKKGNYGFNENPKKAKKLFQKSVKKLLKIAENTYGVKIPYPIFTDEFDHDRTWENFVNSQAAEVLFMLFHDVELFCMPYSTDPAGDAQSRLEKRNYIQRKSSGDILQFAIKDNQFAHYANQLLKIDQNYLFTALQKKPDSIPVLFFRRQLLKAVCKPANISTQMTRAVEFMEYSSEKEISRNFQGGDANLIYDQTMELLQKNPKYAILIKEQYMESYFFTKNTIEKIKQSYNNYILQQNDFYFENYLKNIQELSSVSGVDQNRKILQTLKTMQTEKNKNNFSFLYTLAEVSFRSRYYEQTIEYLELINLGNKLEGYDYYKVKRLNFLIQLLRTG
jgi:hypothetical protein